MRAKHAEVLFIFTGHIHDAGTPATNVNGSGGFSSGSSGCALLVQGQAASVAKNNGVVLQRLFVAAHSTRVTIVGGQYVVANVTMLHYVKAHGWVAK